MDFSKFKVELVDDWKSFYKMMSFWAIVVMGVLPDLYAAAQQFHLVSDTTTVPSTLSHLINLAGFIGVALRLIKQKSLEATPS